jgi:putative transposase
MPRKPRVSLAGVAEHVIQRGNNRQAIFGCEDDMKAYVTWLKQYSQKYNVSIHAWVLMTNHVHILCSPANHVGVSQMMQSLGRMYVMYFNKAYKRSGTLWEGRYRSCLVQNEQYVLELYRYIELNPARAGMVQEPSEYHWSSYQCNALGKFSELITAHPVYLAISKDVNTRQANYRSLFTRYVVRTLAEDIRKATNKGLALGSEQFKLKVAALSGRTVIEGKRGRPVGWKKHVK